MQIIHTDYLLELIIFHLFQSVVIVLKKPDLFISYKGLIMGLLFSHYGKLTPHLWFLVVQIIDLVLIVITFQYIEKKEYRIVA